jgi:NAD(P)-dependent dehydrogenase (short-subunit alcohol dehydrogenase family)
MYGLKDASIKIARTAASLEGKSVAVVGGTAGIGAALARAAAAAGARVIVSGRTLRGALPPRTEFIAGDVSTVAGARALAAALPVEALDSLAFTNGIVPGSARRATADGIEEDMAVSALSRVVMLQAAAPRLKRSARVLVWGFPGTAGLLSKTRLQDLNAEQGYEGGFGFPHMNTVALNEALVHHWAAKGVVTAGFNPGLVPSGIRNALHGGGVLGSLLERLVGLFNPTADAYAAGVLHLLQAPELAAQPGLCFGQAGDAIKPSPEFSSAALVAEWMRGAEALIARADARAAGSKGV